MKRFLCLVLIGLLSIALCACRPPKSPNETTAATESTYATVPSVSTEPSIPTEPTATEPSVTEPTVTEPTTLPTTAPTETTPPPTEVPHSELFLPDVSQEDLVTYFNEVVLDMEYSDGPGDVSLVQKWNIPIRYRISGNPTAEDLAVLDALFAQLNEIPGFPGIYAAQAHEYENLTIRFLDAEAFHLAFSDFLQGELADGAVQFWYFTDSNIIYDGRIGYRTDISQEIRNSVLIEEVINLLGISDTKLRPDSIVYQYSSDVTTPSDVDWLLLKLLYNPAIQCGMNAADCLTILQQLYY